MSASASTGGGINELAGALVEAKRWVAGTVLARKVPRCTAARATGRNPVERVEASLRPSMTVNVCLD